MFLCYSFLVDDVYGSSWSAKGTNGCFFDDPGYSSFFGLVTKCAEGALMCSSVFSFFLYDKEYGGDLVGSGIGFGCVLDLNTGISGSGANYMKVFVWRVVCGDG